VAFVDSFCLELTSVANFPKGSAWELIGWCVGAVFAAQASVRARVALLQDLGTLENKAQFIWAVLQSHVIVHRFVEVDFRCHPSIVKEMSLYMLMERVDPSEISALHSKVESAKQAAAQATKASKLLQTQHNQLKVECAGQKRKYEELENELKQMSTKVARL
jgi:hypothetical protein